MRPAASNARGWICRIALGRSRSHRDESLASEGGMTVCRSRKAYRFWQRSARRSPVSVLRREMKSSLVGNSQMANAIQGTMIAAGARPYLPGDGAVGAVSMTTRIPFFLIGDRRCRVTGTGRSGSRQSGSAVALQRRTHGTSSTVLFLGPFTVAAMARRPRTWSRAGITCSWTPGTTRRTCSAC